MGKESLRPPGVMLLLALMVVVCALSIAIGSRVIPLSDVWHTLWADNAPGAPDAVGVVHSLGIPRTVLGLIVGSAIGAAGALTQGHTRNPLATAASWASTPARPVRWWIVGSVSSAGWKAVWPPLIVLIPAIVFVAPGPVPFDRCPRPRRRPLHPARQDHRHGAARPETGHPVQRLAGRQARGPDHPVSGGPMIVPIGRKK